MPMVRMNRPIGPFWRAKTCSTAARTADLRAFARAVRRGIGLPLGFLRWIYERSGRGEKLLIGLGAIGGVGPDVAGGVVRVDQFRQQRPVVACGIGDPQADQGMATIDAEMVLIAKGRDRQIELAARPLRWVWLWCI